MTHESSYNESQTMTTAEVPATKWPQDQPRTMQQIEETTTFKIYANDLRAVLSEFLNDNLGADEISGYCQSDELDKLMYKIALRSKVR